MSKKVLLGLAFVWLLALTIFAQEVVTIRFSWWGGTDRHNATLKAIEIFEKKYPNIKIKAEYAGWSGYFEKQAVQMAGGTEADVMQINWPWLPIFSPDGTGFYDLYKLSDIIDLSNFPPEVLQLGTVNGKLNGIPVSMTGRVFWYNKTVYDKYGVPIPKTWDDLFAAAKKFPKTIYPIIAGSYDGWLISHLYATQVLDKPMLAVDGTLLWTVDDFKVALGFYKKLIDNRVTPKIPEIAAEGGTGDVPIAQLPSFIMGNYAGLYEWTSAIGKTAEPVAQKGMQLVMGGIPTGPDSKDSGILFKPSMLFAISKNTKYPREAAIFLNFLLNDPDAALALGLTRGVPISKSAYEALQKAGKLAGLEVEGLEYLLSVPSKHPLSPYFEDSRLQTLYREIIDAISYGTMSVDQAAVEMHKRVQQILGEIVKK
ncbi:ABC transporter substrate-binding protein [Pseudothermotoga thermarum]|uniref:Extracellular solute-binding protein family 1 n=1 Tax=Pseudothermotoga thermarum DSM 5069 TaxID=688269 RepID=F7YW02_9THEM|nr:ABC transporter substrate-binding protein [Pseudothermotoga thermarum]AEH50489.1 extracellular solute-binding protein family 1 [Pseudothermotoga thermarum DSM 5069]